MAAARNLSRARWHQHNSRNTLQNEQRCANAALSLLFRFVSVLRMSSGPGSRSAPGLLTMANSGVHSNGSQFFITTEIAEHLNGRSVAFGRVAAGMDVVTAVANLYCIRGKPVAEITVSKCGEL